MKNPIQFFQPLNLDKALFILCGALGIGLTATIFKHSDIIALICVYICTTILLYFAGHMVLYVLKTSHPSTTSIYGIALRYFTGLILYHLIFTIGDFIGIALSWSLWISSALFLGYGLYTFVKMRPSFMPALHYTIAQRLTLFLTFLAFCLYLSTIPITFWDNFTQWLTLPEEIIAFDSYVYAPEYSRAVAPFYFPSHIIIALLNFTFERFFIGTGKDILVQYHIGLMYIFIIGMVCELAQSHMKKPAKILSNEIFIATLLITFIFWIELDKAYKYTFMQDMEAATILLLAAFPFLKNTANDPSEDQNQFYIMLGIMMLMSNKVNFYPLIGLLSAIWLYLNYKSSRSLTLPILTVFLSGLLLSLHILNAPPSAVMDRYVGGVYFDRIFDLDALWQRFLEALDRRPDKNIPAFIMAMISLAISLTLYIRTRKTAFLVLFLVSLGFLASLIAVTLFAGTSVANSWRRYLRSTFPFEIFLLLTLIFWRSMQGGAPKFTASIPKAITMMALGLVAVFLFRFIFVTYQANDIPKPPAIDHVITGIPKNYQGIEGDWGSLYIVSEPDDQLKPRHINYILGKNNTRLYVNRGHQHRIKFAPINKSGDLETLLKAAGAQGFVGLYFTNEKLKQHFQAATDIVVVN